MSDERQERPNLARSDPHRNSGGSADDPPRFVVVDVRELRSLLIDVLDELRAEAGLAGPGTSDGPLLSKAELAKRLGVSTRQIDRLCREGLPYLRVGVHRRFHSRRVDAWLIEQQAE